MDDPAGWPMLKWDKRSALQEDRRLTPTFGTIAAYRLWGTTIRTSWGTTHVFKYQEVLKNSYPGKYIYLYTYVYFRKSSSIEKA